MQIDDQGLLNKDPRFIAVPGCLLFLFASCSELAEQDAQLLTESLLQVLCEQHPHR